MSGSSLVNTGESTVILDGWQLEGKSSWSGDIDSPSQQVNLQPGAYLVVGGDYVGRRISRAAASPGERQQRGRSPAAGL